MDATELNRQHLDLEFLGGTLAEAGIPYHLTEQNEEYALPFLSVEIGVPKAPDTTYLQLVYVPTAALLAETNLLQFFAYLPVVNDPVSLPSAALLNHLNTRTAVGYFGVDGDGKLFYRYVYALPRFAPPNSSNFLEIVDLYSGTLTTFGASLLSLQRGEHSETEVREVVG